MSKRIPNASAIDTQWVKSSHSGGDSNCVEIGEYGAEVVVRDSKNPTGPALVFDPAAVQVFVGRVAGGAFDL
ncbi:DUF397 domain-containing protein [Streptomyces sp. NA04227]|uniref:DUF397 domain-containing protein n=1 Tax=Streptomyces sp. NA04227 TaxID=2742136 RepID=UPI001590CB4A|nr:DUF397 domain-containing protein [Streptomyces sp. NA04227]QKW08033.1 DUF397 domain-containing protein [Streptomyces sp. NA04227]